MNKEEMQKSLDAQGIKYDKRWAEPKLKEFYDANELKIKTIIEEVSGKNDRPIENLTSTLDRTGKFPVTPGGIAIPWSVMKGFEKTKWTYSLKKLATKCVVQRMMYNGVCEDVREYSQNDHGERYLDLAEQFVRKNNQ
jgi:hypothetical protein